MKLGRTVAALAAAVVLGLVLVGLGFSAPFVIAWSVILAAVAILLQLVMPLDPNGDAPRIPVEPDRRSTEISRMAWSLNTHTGVAGTQITRRVRESLRHRLLRHGIDPDLPEHASRRDALIGIGLWDRMSGRESQIGDVEGALDAIERLAPAAAAAPQGTRSTTEPAAHGSRALFRRPRR
jgi:hypothetical protein